MTILSEERSGGAAPAAASGDLLREAIARNAAAVLSLPSAGMLRHHSTRFLGEREEGFFIECPPDEQVLLDQIIADRSAVGVSFKGAPLKIVFTAPVVGYEPAFVLNEQVTVRALLLGFPDDIRPVQRRANYRAAVPLQQPDGRVLAMRMWRIAEHAVLRDRPMAAQELPVTVRDLSTGGVGIVCGVKVRTKETVEGIQSLREVPRLVEGERVRLLVTFGPDEFLMEGRVRHVRRLPDGSLAGGLQFKKLEKDLEGRQATSRLTAIVGELQREEIRRRREASA